MKKKITKKNVTVNNATSNMEGTIMGKISTFNLATSTANTIIEEESTMKRMEELMAQLTNNTKVQDAGYLKKDALKVILNDEFNMNFNKKATRDEMVKAFMAMYKDSIRVADEISYGNVETTPVPVAAVPVGDLDITKDNAPQSVVPVNDAKAKTDKLFALIKACAKDNQKKGFGYTISSYMLQACILNAGAGVSKLKGHTVTPDENKMTQDIYAWLKSKGYIKPLVYSVVEDEKVRVYMSDYNGTTDTKHVKMISYNKSAGYTAKKITSFLVTIR